MLLWAWWQHHCGLLSHLRSPLPRYMYMCMNLATYVYLYVMPGEHTISSNCISNNLPPSFYLQTRSPNAVFLAVMFSPLSIEFKLRGFVNFKLSFYKKIAVVVVSFYFQLSAFVVVFCCCYVCGAFFGRCGVDGDQRSLWKNTNIFWLLTFESLVENFLVVFRVFVVVVAFFFTHVYI